MDVVTTVTGHLAPSGKRAWLILSPSFAALPKIVSKISADAIYFACQP
jgi:hypothetical protein